MTANTDSRFTIGREYCGDIKPRWVLRFCGDWVSKHGTKKEAGTARKEAIAKRRASL